MLQIARLKTNKEEIIKALDKRHFDARPLIDELLDVNEKRRSVQSKIEELKA